MRILLPVLALLVFSACDTQSKEKELAINGFDWASKKIVELQPELNEISGIVYDKAKNSFLAINDEQGILFVLNPDNFTIQQKLKFGKKGDYECVAINEEEVFVLKSNGDVYSMVYDKDSVSHSAVSSYQGPLTEFESFFWNTALQKLSLISKKSAADKEMQANNMYTFDPVNGQYALDNTNKISWEPLREKGVSGKSFHPSGAAVQPGTGNIFIVSSIEKMLIIFSADWTVLSVHHLDENVFRQPEGITFDSHGNLLITNEAADAKPTLILIPVKR
jgi:uncharacterized protein YjiK